MNLDFLWNLFGNLQNHDDWLRFQESRIALYAVFEIFIILYLYVLITSSEKTKKDWFQIVMGLLFLAWGIWATIAMIKEIQIRTPP